MTLFRNFRHQIVLRIVLLSISIYLFVILVTGTVLYATTALVGVIIVYQVFQLIRYTEVTNRRLSLFLQSVRHADFSQSFSTKGLGSSFADLNRAFSEVIEDFRRIREEREEHYRYLQTVVQHVGIGLIAYHKDGQVELINTAAKRLLHIPRLRRIQQLRRLSPELADTLLSLDTGQHTLVKVFLDGDILQLAAYATEFILRGRTIILVSLQNIRNELEEREMEAWQKLIRVLTHEIMNSITPISSLAGSVHDILSDLKPDFLRTGVSGTEESLTDVITAIGTIRSRSEGLLHFVEAYRSLTRMPAPAFREFPLAELTGRVENLMRDTFRERRINYESKVIPVTLKLTADPDMIEQVLINLLKNAADAVCGRPGSNCALMPMNGGIFRSWSATTVRVFRMNCGKRYLSPSLRPGGKAVESVSVSHARSCVFTAGPYPFFLFPTNRTFFGLFFKSCRLSDPAVYPIFLGG